jgi:hypothetical protein
MGKKAPEIKKSQIELHPWFKRGFATFSDATILAMQGFQDHETSGRTRNEAFFPSFSKVRKSLMGTCPIVNC